MFFTLPSHGRAIIRLHDYTVGCVGDNGKQSELLVDAVIVARFQRECGERAGIPVAGRTGECASAWTVLQDLGCIAPLGQPRDDRRRAPASGAAQQVDRLYDSERLRQAPSGARRWIAAEAPASRYGVSQRRFLTVGAGAMAFGGLVAGSSALVRAAAAALESVAAGQAIPEGGVLSRAPEEGCPRQGSPAITDSDSKALEPKRRPRCRDGNS